MDCVCVFFTSYGQFFRNNANNVVQMKFLKVLLLLIKQLFILCAMLFALFRWGCLVSAKWYVM